MIKKLILIDGAGLVYRSFYGIPRHLTNAKGEFTNAVLGFTNIVLNIILQQKPDYIAVAFDKKGPTFRHKEFKEYKATRVKAPQELYDQIPRVKEVISAFGMPLFEVDGFEADDDIAGDRFGRDNARRVGGVLRVGARLKFLQIGEAVAIGVESVVHRDFESLRPAEILAAVGRAAIVVELHRDRG